MKNTLGLHESDNRMAEIIRAFPDMLFNLDRSGNFLSAYRDDNPDALFKSEDFSGKSIRELFKDELSASFMEAIEITLKVGQYVNEFRIFWKKPGVISVNCSRLNENEIICIARDISSQIEAKEALRESEERYRNLIENISEIIYETDENWIITYISPSVEKLLGYSPSVFTGKTLYNLAGENSAVVFDDLSDPGSRKNDYHEKKVFNRKGEAIWIRFTIKPVYNEGKLTGRIGTLVDATEEKKIELSLQKSEKKYRLLAENISDVIWVVNLTQKKATYISPSMKNLRGYSAEEVINQSIGEIFASDSAEKLVEKIKNNTKQLLRNPLQEKFELIEIQQKCKDGSFIWTETANNYRLTKEGDVEVHGITRNIENRKNSELKLLKYAEELKLSEEKFFNIFNNCPVLMMISHSDRRGIIDVNRHFTKTTGYSREEIIGKSYPDLGLFTNSSHAIKISEGFKTEGQLTDFETTLRTKSGSVFTCLLSVQHILLQNSDLILTSAVDISTIKENEKRIEYLLNQQKLLSEISQLVNVPSDPEKVFNEVLMLIGKHIGVSRTYIFETNPLKNPPWTLFEWTNQQIVPLSEYLGKAENIDLTSFKEVISREGFIFTENVNELPEVVFNVLKSHNAKSMLLFPLFVENINGGTIGFDECVLNKNWTSDEIDLLRIISVIISNALERKKVLEKLSLSELKYKLAIDSAKEGLWDWNVVTGEVYYSEMWCRLLGYGMNELKPDYKVWENSIFHEDKQHVLEALNNHIAGKTGTYETSYRMKKRDGQIRWVLDHGMVVERNFRNEATRAIGMIIDITAQKENEIRLQESIKTQQKLFSIISHDLRGPLGNFMQVLELLTKGQDLDDKIKEKLLEELKKSSRTTFSLLENLLNWSKSQTNIITLEPWYYSVSKMLHENVELTAPMANQKFINILVNTDDRLSVYCDRDSINLVIRNLLSNAIKFTRNNGTIRVLAREFQNHIEVEVEDNGIGMESDFLNKIFEPGTFNSSFGTNNEKGSGLGLMLCKDFVERNGGKLNAESTPGAGSRFIFSLPKN